jgi:GH35 family endo-1,4-beta-xylanase
LAVFDRKGKAVPNAQIIVEQTAHKFLFGGVCKDFSIGHPTHYDSDFEKRFLQLFNYATIPFPWDAMEGRKGTINYQNQEQMIDWCSAHQLTAKGGPLIYDWDCPNWLPKDPAALAYILRLHVSNTIAHFNSKIKAWDVIKDVSDEETVVPNGFGYWLKRAGPEIITARALEWAKLSDNDPKRRLLYVDWECSKNREVLNALAQNGNLPDGIGLETRYYDYAIELADVWRLCEAYKRYNRPLHFDEVTILSGDIRSNPPWDKTVKDWASTASGEAKQADYVERFYSILFSHPSVESITWWDFGDKGSYMGAPAGLLRRDGTPKPAFERLRKLIHEKWWTKAALKTDQNGRCATRAFWGSYVFTVKRGAGTATQTTMKFYDEQEPIKIVVN